MDTSPPVVMAVAGTDSGGGAGVAADLKAIAANRAHGIFAVSIITAQNSRGIARVETVSPDMVGAQIDALLDDFDVRSIKTGLLFDLDVVHAVSDRIAGRERLVIDPVLVRADHRPLVDRSVVDAYLTELLPAALVATPNAAEAEVLTGIAVTTPSTAADAAKQLLGTGVDHVVVTGVLTDDEAIDVHASNAGIVELREPRVDTINVHGTGCSFASSIAAQLAHGETPAIAIESAKRYVAEAIRRSRNWRLGAGHGPIDHFGASRCL